MDNNKNRVLGRVLAVEEIVSVTGAKPTAPCYDHITAPLPSETSTSLDCSQTRADSGTVIDSTGPVLDPAS